MGDMRRCSISRWGNVALVYSRSLRRFALVFQLALIIASCASRPPSDTERRALNNPPPEVTAWVERIYPGVVAWFSQGEVSMLAQGRVLTPKESAAASRAGVKSPEKIRVIALKSFPMPQDATTRNELTALGVGSNEAVGRVMGYAVLLKPESASDTETMSHEFVHIAQQERLGRNGFIKRWLVEMKMVGYRRAPLELEAFERQRRF
jgi:hypothetical protein